MMKVLDAEIHGETPAGLQRGEPGRRLRELEQMPPGEELDGDEPLSELAERWRFHWLD